MRSFRRKVSPTPKKLRNPKPDPIWSLDWEESFAREAIKATEKCEEEQFENEAVKAVIACEQLVLQTDDEASMLDAVDAADMKKEEERNKVLEEDAAAAAAADAVVVASAGWPAEDEETAGAPTSKGELGYCCHCQWEPCVWVQNHRGLSDYDLDHIHDVGLDNFPDDGGKSRRFPLYRMMSRIYHGPINNREPLPKCVEKGIQDMIPSPDGSYVKFKY
jgi:hypothetical protein